MHQSPSSCPAADRRPSMLVEARWEPDGEGFAVRVDAYRVCACGRAWWVCGGGGEAPERSVQSVVDAIVRSIIDNHTEWLDGHVDAPLRMPIITDVVTVTDDDEADQARTDPPYGVVVLPH